MDRGSEERKARAILILGAAVWSGGRPSPTLARRTAEAARQWHLGEGQVVIPCGGLGRHPPAEAEVMKALLIEAGVPAGAIHCESASTSTAENIAFAMPILESLGLRSVVIVSDAYHLPRARLMARQEGLIVGTAAPPLKGARPSVFLKGVLREVPAYLATLLGFHR